ncbi:unnamed protein product [Fraxinus pennsylvanica]|uniref:glucan endo-1,3-beta-D-glucosidase n=1 Tax=Fraxinus pennsylvanica TaxID=56036 RepID=A0AAD1Z5R4_9LAMI|nr:unnamed protein product [Fraxinus pennsylvanica]
MGGGERGRDMRKQAQKWKNLAKEAVKEDALVLSNIGINYGRLGNNLPSPYETIEFLKSMNAGRVKIYDASPEVLKLLSGTRLRVSIMVTNDQISDIASNLTIADQWVLDNVLAYYPNTKIRSILVGNEVLSYDNQKMWADLVPAMQKIKKSLVSHNIHNIKVGTPLAIDVVESIFPPSSGKFKDEISDKVMIPLLKFLNGTKSYFFLDVYPYFSWSENPTNISLDFALFKDANQMYNDTGSGLVYTNFLDQMLDSVVFAMRKLGFENIRIGISETGWPNGGDMDQTGANIYNAATYNRNLVRKMTASPAIGTPARPGVVIPTFLFSLYDENQKFGPGTERHWGLLNPNGTPIYELDLTGVRPENDYPQLQEPLNNEPFKGKLWCVVATQVDTVELGPALDFACRLGNGTCDELAPLRSCYQPVSEVAHASYAFSSYWAKFRDSGASCYFNGLAVQTTSDPSHGSCEFPSVTL